MQKLVEDAVLNLPTLMLRSKYHSHFSSKNRVSFSSLYKCYSDCAQKEITIEEHRAPEQWNKKEGSGDFS